MPQKRVRRCLSDSHLLTIGHGWQAWLHWHRVIKRVCSRHCRPDLEVANGPGTDKDEHDGRVQMPRVRTNVHARGRAWRSPPAKRTVSPARPLAPAPADAEPDA